MASMLACIWTLVLVAVSLLLHVAPSPPLALRKDCYDRAWFDGIEARLGIASASASNG